MALTYREREVISLAADGLTRQEIADHLVVADSTVKTQLESIVCKLQARNTAHAAAIAVRGGLYTAIPHLVDD